MVLSLKQSYSCWIPTFRHLIGWVLCGSLAILMIVSSSQPAAAEDYTKRDLQGRNFAGMDITDSNFLKANLRGSDLNHVYAIGVDLFGTNLSGANLQGANLRAATLDMANLTAANLSEADLTDSTLWLAQVRGTLIEGADFTNALLRGDTLQILCESASGVNPVTGRATRESLECD